MLYIAGGGMQTISTQSTAVQLSTTSKPCNMVVIQGVSSNTSMLVVANSTAQLSAASRVGIPVYWGSTSQPVTVFATDVSQLYIDGISTEKVSYVYYKYGMAS
jgi:hypothetical protein